MRIVCKICNAPIPAIRLEASPRALTCSRACADENRRQLKLAAKRRWARRERTLQAD